MDPIRNNIVAQTTTPVDSSVVLAKSRLTMAAGRYPKRTRTHIDYSELEREESEVNFEDELDERPPPSKV